MPANRRHVFNATLFLDQTGRMSYAPLWFVTLPEMEFRAEHYGVTTTWCNISTWMILYIKCGILDSSIIIIFILLLALTQKLFSYLIFKIEIVLITFLLLDVHVINYYYYHIKYEMPDACYVLSAINIDATMRLYLSIKRKTLRFGLLFS